MSEDQTHVHLSAIDTLHAAGSTWQKDPAGRAAMTLASHDADDIPRVKDAGATKTVKGTLVQVMHNGLYVKQEGYQGQWEAKVIEGLKGIHEPQEEKVFYEVLKRLKSGGVMIELGSWWCYYSMWYLKAMKKSTAICLEPDPENIKLGKVNMGLNGFEIDKDVFFCSAAAGANDKAKISFTGENGDNIDTITRSVDGLVEEQKIDRLDILHIDIQGAELDALAGAKQSIQKGIVRFVFISTHHYAISGNPVIHRECLDFIANNGGTVVAQHTVLESCSGDGLIVASFKAVDKDFHVEVAHNPVSDSLFRSSEEDINILWKDHNEMLSQFMHQTRQAEDLANLHRQEIKIRDKQIIVLEQALDEVTPLRKHIKKHIRYQVSNVDNKITRRLSGKNNFKASSVSVPKTVSELDVLLKKVKEVDAKNFEAFNKAPQNSPALPVYKAMSKVAKKSVNTVRPNRKKD